MGSKSANKYPIPSIFFVLQPLPSCRFCQTHFCVIYTLLSGAELFGGAPSEQSVGLELEEEVVGLRRRGQVQKTDGETGMIWTYILK